MLWRDAVGDWACRVMNVAGAVEAGARVRAGPTGRRVDTPEAQALFADMANVLFASATAEFRHDALEILAVPEGRLGTNEKMPEQRAYAARARSTRLLRSCRIVRVQRDLSPVERG